MKKKGLLHVIGAMLITSGICSREISAGPVAIANETGAFAPLLLAVKTGDDDDIDDLIVERAEQRSVDRARTGSGSAKETEDDLYVGNKPKAETGPGTDLTPLAAPAHIKRANCGTFWTGWADKLDPKTNPCPSDCEPGEKLQEKNYQQDDKNLIDRQYQCYRVLGTSVLNNAPRLSSEAVGTLTPASGDWGTLVRVTGENFGSAESVRVFWYPNDDNSQPATMQQTATLYQRHSVNEIEIIIPNDPAKSGWSSEIKNGVVRVYLSIPNQLQPVFAGRFSLLSLPTATPSQTITAERVVMTGRWPTAVEAVKVTSEMVRMTGRWPTNVEPVKVTAEMVRMTGRWPATIEPVKVTSEVIRMTGRWPTTVEPVKITSEVVRMTGRWPL